MAPNSAYNKKSNVSEVLKHVVLIFGIKVSGDENNIPRLGNVVVRPVIDHLPEQPKRTQTITILRHPHLST